MRVEFADSMKYSYDDSDIARDSAKPLTNMIPSDQREGEIVKRGFRMPTFDVEGPRDEPEFD